MTEFKRMFVDIETCPNLGWFWQSGYKLTIPPENILEERRIICICWKWEGEKKVYSLDWGKGRDDKDLIEKFVKELNSAHEIVYQNGDRFDLPWIKARAMKHRISMYPSYRTFDTYKKAKSNLKLNSYKLDYMQKFFGGKGKMETGGAKLWKDATFGSDKDSRKAVKHMVEYCKQDVLELEEFFNILSPYVTHNTHIGAYRGEEKWTCPECGNHDVHIKSQYTTAVGTQRNQMVCNRTAKHNSKMPRYYTISNAAYNQYLKKKEEYRRQRNARK